MKPFDVFFPELGQIALIIAFVFSALQVLVPLVGVQAKQIWLMNYARPLAAGQALFLVVSLVMLTLCFLNDDFSVAYVAAKPCPGCDP